MTAFGLLLLAIQCLNILALAFQAGRMWHAISIRMTPPPTPSPIAAFTTLTVILTLSYIGATS